MRHSAVVPLVLLSLLPLVPGCGRGPTPVDEGNRRQILHLGNGAEPADLDPQILTAFTEYNIMIALFEGLVMMEEETMAPVPGVAERWDVSADGLEYVFYLRDDARWSNGDSVTADDFVFSYRRMLSPALGSEYAYLLWCLENARSFNEGKLDDFDRVGVEALDARTLRLRLERPTPYLLPMLSHLAWFPVHPATILQHGPIDRRGTAWTRPENFVGNGAFALKAWIPNDRIEVKRNPHYWDTVHLEEIHFHPIESAAVEERAFRAGQLHITYELPLAKIDAYRRNQPDILRLDPFLETFYIRFNLTRPPLDNPRIRQALARAIDRRAIVENVTRGGQTPAHHYTPPNTGGYTAEARVPTDFDEARRLLADAGYPGGRGFPVLELIFNTSEINQKILEAIQAMWRRELGIRIELTHHDFRVYLDRLRQLDYDIGRARWIGDFADPVTFLDMFVTDGGNNQTGYANPEYDRLIAAAAEAVSPKQRFDTFQQAEALLLNDAPIAPVFFGTRVYLVHPAVQGWKSSILGFHQYKNIQLIPPARN